MNPIGEKLLEDAIEDALVNAPGSGVAEGRAAYGRSIDPRWQSKNSGDYDKTLCLIPNDVLDFVSTTQPKEWKRLREILGDDAGRRFLQKLASEVDRKGTLEVLRRGIKERGVKVRLAYFRPHSGLNDEHQRLYGSNLFSIVRQLHYSAERGSKSLDVGLFLNGLPIFTAELKNQLSGQTVTKAVEQYRQDRDPREPLFAFGRCLAHFAVDTDQVFVTTHLNGPRTRFLPFNKGYNRGAGNPPGRITEGGYKTGYLWNEIWAKDSVLNLIQHFVHQVQKPDDTGGKAKSTQIQLFPRYHQVDTVRRLIAHAREHGAGHRYLIQHSAGSGKSFTIAWLAHWLSVLHDDRDRRVFDSIIVITDRKVLDQQLQDTVRQFEQTLGVVENIDTTSKQLKQALEEGKTIIVTTLQKFPVILDQVAELGDRRFAMIVDEAHSSQGGESRKALKAVLGSGSLEEAAEAEGHLDSDDEDRFAETMAAQRGHLGNASTFAFTATPKPKTLELFGQKQPNGKFEPFSLYSMRQAIEEGFILDVLENYTTYKTYWRLLRKIEDDPEYDRARARSLLKAFAELHEHTIEKKVEIMVDHFHHHSAHRIGNKAKAMIVTRSRLHCVRTKRILDRVLAERGLPYESLVAFSGTVEDGGAEYTESNMNGIPDSQTKAAFERPEVRFLVVANKFQTGFDQPLLHTMYVDKKLANVAAVQTLSRLNRTHPDKKETMVLDFANEASVIQKSFERYYETTLLSEESDPDVLYERQHELEQFAVFTEKDVDEFARLFFRHAPQDRLYASLEPSRVRAEEQLDADELVTFRALLDDYARQYAFLAQVMPFTDADLEKLYHFARFLRRRLSNPEEELPREIQEQIDLESLRVQQTFAGPVELEPGHGELDPQGNGREASPSEEQVEPLSRIIQELNERFGGDLGAQEVQALHQVMDQMEDNEPLRMSVENNTEENARLAFESVVTELLQDLVETNFKLYKRIASDKMFSQRLMTDLFEAYRDRVVGGRLTEDQLRGEIAEGESKLLELKSTLRKNLRTGEHDERMTHAVLKSVAAFLNTDGGVLYLGVADDGEILGLDADDFPDGDKFLLHLINKVKTSLGKTAAARITPTLWTLDDRQICRVECPPSSRPVFLKAKGKNEEFYVRMGPSSEALALSDMRDWLADRFAD